MAGLIRTRLHNAAQAASMFADTLRSSVGCAGTADGELEDLADALNGALCHANAAQSAHAAFTTAGLEKIQEQIEQLENAAQQLENINRSIENVLEECGLDLEVYEGDFNDPHFINTGTFLRWHHRRPVLWNILQQANDLGDFLLSITNTLNNIASQQRYHQILHSTLSDNPWPPPALYNLGLCPETINHVLSVDCFDLDTVIHWQNHLSNANLYRYYKGRLFERRAEGFGWMNSYKKGKCKEAMWDAFARMDRTAPHSDAGPTPFEKGVRTMTNWYDGVEAYLGNFGYDCDGAARVIWDLREIARGGFGQPGFGQNGFEEPERDESGRGEPVLDAGEADWGLNNGFRDMSLH
jgi:hypothetical protein